MRILQVSKFYPPVMGGIESVAWELTEGLNRVGCTTDVLCSNQEWRTRQEQAESGYRVWRAGALGRVLSTSIAPAMVALLNRFSRQADIVHLHMPDPMAAVALRLVRPNCKVVVHWHSDVIRQRRAMRLYEPLQSWVLERADAVIATSQAYVDSSSPLAAWRNKVHVVPIGVSDHRSQACAAKVAEIQQAFRGRRLVFALGRMTYYKGFEVLIEAARRLPQDCAVLIGGDGELLEHYRGIVNRSGLAGKVHLPGHIADDMLASCFKACDVFCMPSTVRAEAYGVAILEAMVMGKPVVASNVQGSGVPWVNQHGSTGLNVPVADAAALAESARARYEREFTAETMTDRTLGLYRRLIDGQIAA
jgi:glycosyltransferase involved in cell wall biosynthesis